MSAYAVSRGDVPDTCIFAILAEVANKNTVIVRYNLALKLPYGFEPRNIGNMRTRAVN